MRIGVGWQPNLGPRVRDNLLYNSRVLTRAKLPLPAQVAGAHSTRGFARAHTGWLAVRCPGTTEKMMMDRMRSAARDRTKDV